jgi:Asp-tRNA(Asn)/Glu-tRNA(Gln) amidotransferase A subunit family amidase
MLGSGRFVAFVIKRAERRTGDTFRFVELVDPEMVAAHQCRFGLSGRGLPLGLQLVGRPFDEEAVLRAAALEQAAIFAAAPAGC